MKVTFRTLAIAAAVAALASSAWASIYGTMSNFDVFNDTTEDSYGAELELEGVHSTDVYNTYPAVAEDSVLLFSRRGKAGWPAPPPRRLDLWRPPGEPEEGESRSPALPPIATESRYTAFFFRWPIRIAASARGKRVDALKSRRYDSRMRITHVRPHSGFRLELHFDNGESGIVDLQDFVGRGVFAAWERPGVFEQVVVTSEGAIEWPGEIDVCPDSLYLRMTGKKPEELSAPLRNQVSHA